MMSMVEGVPWETEKENVINLHKFTYDFQILQTVTMKTLFFFVSIIFTSFMRRELDHKDAF